ncbi:MAG TPA: EamA family transporter RarD [Candidatus Nanopelagicaceae bacterium]
MKNRSHYTTGLIYGVGANTLWGLLPLYWKFLHKASAFEILANRGVWSLVFCFILLTFRREMKSTLAIFRKRNILRMLMLTSVLLGINWGTYIWSVSVDRIVEASLGYYIAPLVNIAFGVFMFHERLRRFQWVAVILAAAGVVVLTVQFGAVPWIALVIAFSWGTYTLLKKTLNLGALEGLSIETTLTLPFFLIYLIWIERQGSAQFGTSVGFTLLLVSAGIVTVVPLLLFNGAATRLPLSITGLLQYIIPTIMFAIGTLVNHESMPIGRVIGFAFIWAALTFLGYDLVKSNRNSTESS